MTLAGSYVVRPLPPKPRRALAFGNHFTKGRHLSAVQDACRAADLKLDVIGLGSGYAVSDPENMLASYDVGIRGWTSLSRGYGSGNRGRAGRAEGIRTYGHIAELVTTAQNQLWYPYADPARLCGNRL